MPAAIYFQPEAFTTDLKLMGRTAAGESFLRGLLQSNGSEEAWAFAESKKDAEFFMRKARATGAKGKVHMIGPHNMQEIGKPGTLFYPGPDIARQAWRRSKFDSRRWSICGVTHTTASASVMDSLADLLTAPTHPWDAVICTSYAVKENVEFMLEAQARYLKDRFSATQITYPALPVIPLGVHTGDFRFSNIDRASARTQLQISDEDDVVLYVGRLAFHGKSNPLAMYQALERAQQMRKHTGRRTVLIECGWFAGDAVKRAYEDAREAICPSIRSIVLDGRAAANRQTAWACADIACSLVDNIQETFGIVPVEAMAAGLPMVVSDWDGYRDTIRDGAEGFRIPTTAPRSGLGGDIATRHALEIDSYDVYIGMTSAFGAVDVDAATQALSNLLNDPNLRRNLGEAGRKRAMEIYDWKTIIGRYEALWGELAEVRAAATAPGSDSHGWPMRPDPFSSFSGYPSSHLSETSDVRLAFATSKEAIDRLAELSELRMVAFSNSTLPETADLHAMLTRLADGPTKAARLVESFPPAQRLLCLRALSWLMKLGIVSISNAPPPTSDG